MSRFGDDNTHAYDLTDREYLDRQEDDWPNGASANELQAVHVSAGYCDLCWQSSTLNGDILYDMRTDLASHDRECPFRVAREKEQR